MFTEQVLRFKTADMEATFKLPVVSKVASHVLDEENLDELVKAHTSFRTQSEQVTPMEKSRKAAQLEAHAIRATFLEVHDLKVQTCMAAWLFLLCYIDDLVEDMSPHAARHILIEISAKFQNQHQASLELGTLDQPDSPPSSFADLIKLNSSEDMTRAKKIRHAVKCFQEHTSALLSSEARQMQAFYDDISRVFSAMEEEVIFRAEKSNDLEGYLKIRMSTIGLMPFFALLLPPDTISLGISDHLAMMEVYVCIIIGLQNDVIGLEKDLSTGEWMNYIVLQRMRRGHSTQPVALKLVASEISKAIHHHNDAVEQLCRLWRSTFERGIEAEIGIGRSLVIFVAEHYRWAAASKRYAS